MTAPACMGGWCRRREDCARYHAQNREAPVERLCEPGQDGTGSEYPVHLHCDAGAWRHSASQLGRATPFDMLQVAA